MMMHDKYNKIGKFNKVAGLFIAIKTINMMKVDF